jgi:hypothetical protein
MISDLIGSCCGIGFPLRHCIPPFLLELLTISLPSHESSSRPFCVDAECYLGLVMAPQKVDRGLFSHQTVQRLSTLAGEEIPLAFQSPSLFLLQTLTL